MIDVRLIQNESERDACYLIRMKVFVEEQNVPPWEEIDEFDESAEHYALIVDDVIIGTARLVDKGDGVGKIGRVALASEYRGKGLGRLLMESILKFTQDRYHLLTLDAQLYVIPFYESLGFAVEGGVFLDAEIEHRKMSLRLSPSAKNV